MIHIEFFFIKYSDIQQKEHCDFLNSSLKNWKCDTVKVVINM